MQAGARVGLRALAQAQVLRWVLVEVPQLEEVFLLVDLRHHHQLVVTQAGLQLAVAVQVLHLSVAVLQHNVRLRMSLTQDRIHKPLQEH